VYNADCIWSNSSVYSNHQIDVSSTEREEVSYINNQEFSQMMQELAVKEEKRLGLGNPTFIQRRNEIMDEANRQFLRDLAMEQQETM
jgi:hypothetical protein